VSEAGAWISSLRDQKAGHSKAGGD